MFRKAAHNELKKQKERLLKLSQKAADYMIDSGIVIRNSDTKQLISLHYGKGIFPETHSPGGGTYSVPLWTVGTKNLEEKTKNLAFTPADSKTHLDLTQDLLDEYLGKIKEFIAPYVPFGHLCSGLLDYELLVGSDRSYYLDDIGRYPTGGRSHTLFNEKTILYRITLNGFEIDFIKDILQKKYDNPIPFLSEAKNEIVSDMIRYEVCHVLCVQIIAAKLVKFLNSAGKPKNVIALNKEKLETMLGIAINGNQSKLKEMLERGNQGDISIVRDKRPPEVYLTSVKNSIKPKPKPGCSVM